MATWKKVVVSGSAVSQLNNDSGYLISGQSGAVVLSGSFSGSFQGDGSNLTGISADTLANSLIDGNGIADFTFNGSAGASVAVEADGSTLSVGSGGVKVADAGITATQLATSVAGDGLAGGGGTALSVNTDTNTITTSGDNLTLVGTTYSSSVASRIASQEAFSSSLDATFATEAELHAATASLSASLATPIATNAGNISTNTGDISTNTGNISTNTGNISTNATNIGNNDTDIAAILAATSSFATTSTVDTLSGSLAGRVKSQEAFSSSLDATFATEAELHAATASISASLGADIATNVGNISTNTGNISTNTGNISTNTGNISTNTGNISTNTSNISTAQAGVNSLTAATSSYAVSSSVSTALDGKQGSLSITDTSGQGGVDITLTGDTLSAQTVGLGASANVQFADITATGDVIVQGDLTVNGTTTSINTTNLDVEDKFILLNSGSANPDEGGIVIDEGSGTGHAFLLDSASTRFGFKASLDSTTSGDVTPEAFVSAVVDVPAGHSDTAEYQKNGNIKVLSNGDIFIYS
jgi:hypothetical protein